jgi:ribosome-associated protein
MQRGAQHRPRYNFPDPAQPSLPLTSQAHVIKTRLPSPPPALDTLLRTVHDAVENLKAKDVVEIDVRGKSSVTDYMVIASGTSTRHVKSIADEVIRFAKNLDVMPLGVEGEREAEWVLVDLGDVVVHVMLPRVREFYALERLWTVGDQPPDEIDEYGDDHRDARGGFDDDEEFGGDEGLTAEHEFDEDDDRR